jgi:hypothetical protein
MVDPTTVQDARTVAVTASEPLVDAAKAGVPVVITAAARVAQITRVFFDVNMAIIPDSGTLFPRPGTRMAMLPGLENFKFARLFQSRGIPGDAVESAWNFLNDGKNT